MLRLTSKRRAVLAEKIPDAANLITGAVVVAFLLGETAVSQGMFAATLVVWTGALVLAIIVAGDDT
jgi:hypothetical protein